MIGIILKKDIVFKEYFMCGYLRKSLISIFLVMIICLSTSCTNHDVASNKSKTESFVDENSLSIQTVCKYLSSTQFNTVYIDKADGQMYADSETKKIEDSNIINSINILWNAGCRHISLSRRYNVIVFRLGQELFSDFEFGLAYPINADSDIWVEFQTELTPIINTEYYFYESEYNKWRLSQNSEY